ncbi:MAG: helix-turn-helix domain-containing protein [Streptosporangiaceae bacterium]
MSAGQEWTITLGTGTSLVHDGELWTVTGLDGEAVTLRGRGGRSLRVRTSTLLTAPGTRIVGVREDLPAAAGPLLDDLTGAEREQLAGRLGHVRELLTGYVSGSDAAAAEGEPRPEYDPSLPAGDREAAKAAELGVSARTVRRWVAGYLRAGAAGLVDGRSVRPSDVLAGADERWLAMCKIVLGEHTEASRPTRNLVLRRVSARLEAEHGPGTVREPGVKKARAVLEELTQGTNAFAGSTKAKRSIAARPAGVYGRLRATRPGEYVLLDTTPLDVFAMESVTLRWVRCELTVAMDLFSRCITGLRLSPVSTKAVDAATVLFETLRPSRHGTAAGVLPYAGLPGVVVTAGSSQPSGPRAAGTLAGVAAETVVVDHGKVYLSEHLMAVCERLGISVQPARPLTPTDKPLVSHCTLSGRFVRV